MKKMTPQSVCRADLVKILGKKKALAVPRVLSEEIIVLCTNDSFFSDDLSVECCECFTPLKMRPHYPKEAKAICVRCIGHRL